MNFLNRPHFRFHGDIEEAKTLYMQAWHYLQNMKQFVVPGLGIQGPFRRVFDDGTEFLVQCIHGVDKIDIFVPELQHAERELQEEQRFFQPILIINVYYRGMGTYISEYVDEETWIRETDKQSKAAEVFDKDIKEFSSLCAEHPHILNINSTIYNEEESKKDIATALASRISYGFWCATIGYDPDVPFPENNLYEDIKEVTEIYKNTLPHPEYGTWWLITGLEDLQEIFNTFNERIKEDIRPGAYGTITLPTIVVMNLQEYARAYNSYMESGEMGPVDDEVSLFVEWFKEQPGSGDIFVNHWFGAAHALYSDIPYARDAWCDPLMPGYESGCGDNILSEPAGGYEEFEVHITEYRAKGQTTADVAGDSDVSSPTFLSPWWGRWISWISRTVMFHCKIDEEAFNMPSKERYQEQESFKFTQGVSPGGNTRFIWEGNFETLVAVEWERIAYYERTCRYFYGEIDFIAYPLLQEKNEYINRWELLGKNEWTETQRFEDAYANGLDGTWSIHNDIYTLPDDTYPPYHGYEGTIDDPAVRTDCPGEQECKCIWVVINETPWEEFLQIPVFDTFWDDSRHEFTQAVDQYG